MSPPKAPLGIREVTLGGSLGPGLTSLPAPLTRMRLLWSEHHLERPNADSPESLKCLLQGRRPPPRAGELPKPAAGCARRGREAEQASPVFSAGPGRRLTRAARCWWARLHAASLERVAPVLGAWKIGDNGIFQPGEEKDLASQLGSGQRHRTRCPQTSGWEWTTGWPGHAEDPNGPRHRVLLSGRTRTDETTDPCSGR